MNHTLNVEALLMVAALLASSMATAQAWPDADYLSGKTRLRTELKVDRQACARLAADAGNLCVEQAKLRHTVARDALRSRFIGPPDRQTGLLAATAKP